LAWTRPSRNAASPWALMVTHFISTLRQAGPFVFFGRRIRSDTRKRLFAETALISGRYGIDRGNLADIALLLATIASAVGLHTGCTHGHWPKWSQSQLLISAERASLPDFSMWPNDLLVLHALGQLYSQKMNLGSAR
jgi:hypothetical protein